MRAAEEEKKDLLTRLADLRFCAKYLGACYRESNETFLMALRNVAEAQKGMKKLSIDAGVNRENLYRMLSEGGNPRLDSLRPILEVLGIDLDFRSAHPVAATPPGVGAKDSVESAPKPTGESAGGGVHFLDLSTRNSNAIQFTWQELIARGQCSGTLSGAHYTQAHNTTLGVLGMDHSAPVPMVPKGSSSEKGNAYA
jgi:probable addiction module antidote protein